MAGNERTARAPAVFLDRDGTLMRDVDYCARPEQVEVFADVPGALTRLKAAGFRLIVISNQSGIGRGYFTEADYHAVATELNRQLGAGLLDGTYFCPDLPESGSTRRKPAPGMIHEAEREHALDLARSFMVGDKAIDVECGRNAGVRTILVHTGKPSARGVSGADWEADTLSEAADLILRHAR